MSDITLTLTAVPRSNFTSQSLLKLTELGLEFIRTVPSTNPPSKSVQWKSAAKGDATTKLWKTVYNDETWVARVTTVDLPYDLVRKGLVDKKLETEQACLCGPLDVLEKESEEDFADVNIKLEVFRKALHIQKFSGRDFLQSIVYRDIVPPSESKGRSFVIVSVPIEGELRSKSDVRGRYAQVEYVQEMSDGKIEVILTLCSDAGGSIPRWVQNMGIPGHILGEVNSLVKHLTENGK